MRVSCIICTYRRTDVLGKAIDSLARQSAGPHLYEVIVVDNNSGDETPHLVEEKIHAYPHVTIRYVVEYQQGLSHGRNRGIDEARGDIIAFIDDDASASTQWIQELIRGFDTYPTAEVIGGKITPIWESTRPAWIDHHVLLARLSMLDLGSDEKILYDDVVYGTNMAFRRQTFIESGTFNVKLGRIGNALLADEETDIQERIRNAGGEIYYLPNAEVGHLASSQRLTRSTFIERERGLAQTNVLRFIQRDNPPFIKHTTKMILLTIEHTLLYILAIPRRQHIFYHHLMAIRYFNISRLLLRHLIANIVRKTSLNQI